MDVNLLKYILIKLVALNKCLYSLVIAFFSTTDGAIASPAVNEKTILDQAITRLIILFLNHAFIGRLLSLLGPVSFAYWLA